MSVELRLPIEQRRGRSAVGILKETDPDPKTVFSFLEASRKESGKVDVNHTRVVCGHTDNNDKFDLIEETNAVIEGIRFLSLRDALISAQHIINNRPNQ